jgi:hypothetical protein
MKRLLLLLLLSALMPAVVSAQQLRACWRDGAVWECGALPGSYRLVGVEYVSAGERIAVPTGSTVITEAECVLNRFTIRTTGLRGKAVALQGVNSVQTLVNDAYVLCSISVYERLPDRVFGETRTFEARDAWNWGTSADLSGAVRQFLGLGPVAWIIAIVGGGLLGAQVVSAIIALATGGDDDGDDEYKLYEYLKGQGYDRETADSLAVGYREYTARDSDD